MKSSVFALSALAALATSAFAASEPTMEKVIAKRDTAKPTDVEILNFALTLEYLERNFYADALKKFSAEDFKKAGYPAKVHERFVTLGKQEANHVKLLSTALGDAAVKQCKYIYGLSSVKAVVATARLLENVGVAAYSGAAPDISNKAYLAVAASIVTVEARHASLLNEAQGASGFPEAYDSPLTYDQVYSLAAPIFVPNSCGAGQLPPGLQAFPALEIVTKVPRAGHTSAIKFAEKSGYSGDYYGAFIADNQIQYVKINKASQTVNVPKGLSGLTYLVVTTSSSSVASADTVAGPGVLYLA
ncbi:ferritin-like domain-containing protein [Sporobolomyces koalae]|uniref:ferritin-like domain-containing protein n=1 Tax=Sporobolomyces koalae TaxID=500713 RepID=UPI003170F0E1